MIDLNQGIISELVQPKTLSYNGWSWI